MVQLMSHIVNECHEAMLSDGDLQRFPVADTDTVSWLERKATTVLAK